MKKEETEHLSVPFFQSHKKGASTTSLSMSSTSVNRCRRCRQTDVDDVDFEVLEEAYSRL